MAWKKQGDAYFADTFDRDTMLCSMDCSIEADKAVSKGIPINSSGELSFTVNNVSCCNTLNELTGYTTATAGNIDNWTISCDNVMVNGVDTVRDKLEDLQAQINALKKNLEKPKVTNGLRSALKTLQYKREVE